MESVGEKYNLLTSNSRYNIMRKTFIILCIWNIIVGCSQEQKEEDTPSKEKEEWELVWEDDFNRDDIFATGIWSKIWGCPTSKADWCKLQTDNIEEMICQLTV